MDPHHNILCNNDVNISLLYTEVSHAPNLCNKRTKYFESKKYDEYQKYEYHRESRKWEKTLQHLVLAAESGPFCGATVA